MARLLRPVTKIISVIPAAAASSTANWISGLSTTGSISFGLALVTGRKRLPIPATGNTALVSFLAGMSLEGFQEIEELRLVEHGDAELARLVELAAGFVAGHHVVRLLRHRAAHLVSLGLDGGLRLVAAHARERAGEDEGLRIGRRPGVFLTNKRNSLREAADHVAVVRLAHEFFDALHQLRSDSLQRHGLQRLVLLLPPGIFFPNCFFFAGQG